MKDEHEPQPTALRHTPGTSAKSEFDFIASLKQRVTASTLKSESLIAGIGDDAENCVEQSRCINTIHW